MDTLTHLMTHFCTCEDSWLARRHNNNGDSSTSEVRDENGKPRRHKNNKRHNRGHISDTEEGAANAGFSNQCGDNKWNPFQCNKDGLSTLDRILDKPCTIHGTPVKPATHSNRNCWVIDQPEGVGGSGRCRQRWADSTLY